MTLLGGVLGSLLASAVVLGLSALRPALARGPALLGWLALVVGTGLSLWPLLTRNTDPTSFFAAIYLGLGVLAGLLFALPRRRRWREAGWVSWGLGLLTPLLLTLGGLGVDAGLAQVLLPDQKAVVSYGFVNGLLWSLLPALGVALLLARAGQKAPGK
jgi:hypothetical protein